jgi:putative PEP-CTERM system histidine kinase
MRWRIKFMILGLGVLFAVLAYTSSQALLYGNVNPALQVLFSGAVLVGSLLITRSLFRSGHFEVSVYPSQLVLHNSLTVLLAGVYLVIVGVLAKAVALLGGAASFPFRAFLVLIGLVVLSVILLSDRMRLHLRQFISRHFQRPLYDYRTVWRNFAEATARCLEERQLCSAVVKLSSGIFQALSVTIWLVDEKHQGLHLAASSSLNAGEGKMQPADASELIAAFSDRADPVDIDSSREFWASALRRAHPGEFRKGGNRAAVALKAGGEMLGILTLGDRVGGIAFSLQDFDLLKAVADQAAASLLNIKLAQKLSQAKQLEAFQAMSAFFVHDLKNTASTLSLMLQNLPVHYHDPKFREDALRGISKTVTHINDLIGRLSVLRHELAIQAVECDLNTLVQDTLAIHEQAGGLHIQKHLQELPKVRLDPGQVQKVLTNLLMNAKEAVGPNGQVMVETGQANGWAVVTVTDDGCGMTPEFIDQRLFRPFQTTKKRGIGIGMFHCKMIVEAHRGRIEVRSEPGKGTAFRVLLPISHA